MCQMVGGGGAERDRQRVRNVFNAQSTTERERTRNLYFTRIVV